jgi:hypothetical protein
MWMKWSGTFEGILIVDVRPKERIKLMFIYSALKSSLIITK